jgi:hypothetical protein
MPAIQLARLKIQISHLVERFTVPKDFVASLKEIYDFYSDRTRKTGRGRPISSLTLSFNVPVQVTRLIERDLHPVASAQPEQALLVADALWEENWLECRLLAFSITGWIPTDPSERIVTRIQKWGREIVNDRLLSASLSKAMVRLVVDTPPIILDLLGSWLKSGDPDMRKLGLQVMPSLINDTDLRYLPQLFNLLTPFVQGVNPVPNVVLVDIIRVLAQKSPQETAYFLRRNLALTENPGIYAIIRTSLGAFPPDVKKHLMTFLHQQREEFGGH